MTFSSQEEEIRDKMINCAEQLNEDYFVQIYGNIGHAEIESKLLEVGDESVLSSPPSVKRTH